MIAADDEQFLAGRSVPPGRIIVQATVAHAHAIDDGITQRSAALDDPPTHGSDIGSCHEGMKKVMADPRSQPDTNPMPFDGKRMTYGGFEVIVEA